MVCFWIKASDFWSIMPHLILPSLLIFVLPDWLPALNKWVLLTVNSIQKVMATRQGPDWDHGSWVGNRFRSWQPVSNQTARQRSWKLDGDQTDCQAEIIAGRDQIEIMTARKESDWGYDSWVGTRLRSWQLGKDQTGRDSWVGTRLMLWQTNREEWDHDSQTMT